MFLTIFGLAILAALFATFEGASGDPAAVSSPAVDAGSGSPAGGDPSGVSPTGAALTEHASGSVTPAGEFADLEALLDGDPRKDAFLSRLNELSSQRRQAQDQLTQYTGLDAWAPTIQQLAERGLTPEQLLAQALQAQQPEPAAQPDQSEQQFAGWLQTGGIDPSSWEYLDPAQQFMLRNQFQFTQQQQQATQMAQRAQWQADLQSVAAEVPRFGQKDAQGRNAFTEMLLNTYEGRYGDRPNGAQLLALAKEMDGAIQAQVQSELARYQTQKAGDATVPVPAGGTAPAPVETRNYHELSDAEQSAMINSFWSTANRQS